jgi:hypothetical protein
MKAPTNAIPPSRALPAEPSQTPKPKSRWRFFRYFLLVLVLLLVTARLAMPHALRWYVNRTLDKSQVYQGKIGNIEVHLWKGGYSIHDIRLVKMTGNVPVPLFAAHRVQLAMEWSALRHGKLVGRILMENPQINFVDAPDSGESQTGAEGPWLQIIRDLFPFKINSAEVQNGSIHFRTYTAAKPVDVYLGNLSATIDNLTNIRDETTPLLTVIDAKALAMDQAKFEYKMKLDPFSYRPTYHLAVRLIGLDVTKINDLALTYGAFDFKRGWFDLVVELDSREGSLEGYVKPLFRNLEVFRLGQDLKQDNPIQFFWQAVVGVTTRVLSNQQRDQFGTLIPFRGSDNGSSPDILATVGNVLRNAFIRAYLPKLQGGPSNDTGLQFEAPTLSDPISAGDSAQ